MADRSKDHAKQPEPRSVATPRLNRSVPDDGGSPEIVTPQAQTRLREQRDRFDPRNDGWDSETTAQLATDQLGKLSKLLSRPSDIVAEQLAGLADDSFACADLRPESLEDAFRDPTIHVRRAATAPTAAELPRHRGVPGIADALRELLAVFAGDSTVRAKFKLFRIEGGPESIVTQSYYSATGSTRQGRVEQNALWECRWIQAGPHAAPRIVSIRVSDHEEAELQRPDAVFADCTVAVLGREPCYQSQFLQGLDDWRELIEKRFDVYLFGHHGLAIGDANGDGLEDVYVCQPGGLPNRLFVQQPDGTAIDVSGPAGVDVLDFSRSALLVDIDNDGDQDLVVSTLSALLLFSNDGAGVFTLRARNTDGRDGYSLAAADFDLDGDLDLYICRYSNAEADAGRFPEPMPYHDANNGAANVLLRNDGDWHFSDVTAEVGLDEHNRRFSFAASWEDYDDDGYPDLYVANDFGRKNLYHNDRGRFHDVAAPAGVEDIGAGMSVSWGDYNRDGKMDLYVGNMFSAAGNRITFQSKFQAGASADTKKQIQRLARGNSLLENAGNGVFRDRSEDAAVTMGRWAWGSLFADINNDGWEDLLVTNGFLTRKNPDDL